MRFLIFGVIRFVRRVREADGRIKPGAQAPGKKIKTGVEPAERAAALSPASRARILFITRSWGLRPRLYSAVRFADSAPRSMSLELNVTLVVFNSIHLQKLDELISE